ncbi:MAG: hypothetical protein ABEL76_08410, partial [Bradymonadaceae bacterium]
REMLSAVEDKFNDCMFSQARILLKLFDADRETRVENDRNLFYEEMILRFGIKRRHPLAEKTADSYSRQIGELDADLQDRTDDLFDWLSEEVFVSMNVLGRPVEKREKWREIAANSTREGAIEDFTETFPPRMWRRPEAFSKDLVDLVEEQLSERIVADYIIRHVKACFFILRAVGDTGLEAYLDVFFDWVERDFDVDGPAVLPELYHETTEGNRLIEDIFDDVFRRHFRESAIEYRENWDRDELETAVDGALEHLVDSDPEEIPPGHYDFGGFVLDELFELEYPSDEFRFKLHRLT